MKKVITILAIMMILVGSVFADTVPAGSGSNGTASLDVTIAISAQYPTFQLKSGSATDNVASTHEANYDPADVALTADSLLSDDQPVSFDIVQLTRSSATAKYWLTVTATDMVLVKDASGATISTLSDASIQSFTVKSATPTVSAPETAITGIDNTGTSGNKLVAAYDGTTVAANTTIGSFTATWKKNANAVSGSYKATVTLTVTAQN